MGAHRQFLVAWSLLALVHGLLSLAWFLAGLVWQNRALWFMSGTLVFTHGLAYGLLEFRLEGAAVLATPDAMRRKIWRFGVAALLALVPLLWYAVNLVAAYYSPDGAGDATTRALAHSMWSAEPALATLVFVLVCATALLHLIDLPVLWWLARTHRRHLAAPPARH